MKFAIVSGSHRSKSQSEKVARHLAARLSQLANDVHATVLSLGSNPLPLWDESFSEENAEWQKLWKPFSDRLKDADALVFVVPEWSGMVPPGFKNFLLLCSKELAHKPVLLVAVSSDIAGSYPIAELRMSSYKNTHVSYLPEHLIIRKVEEVLNGDQINSALDEAALRERIDYSLKLLHVYAKAYQGIRATTEVDLFKYPYGM